MSLTQGRSIAAWRVRASALGLLLLSASTAIGWMAGDLSEADYPDGFSQDYLLRPLSLDPQAALAIGSASLIVLGMASFLVLRDQADRRSWLGAAIAVLGTSVIIGIGYRVITAGVGGANIGGGMAVLFGGPFVIALLAWTAAKVWSLRPGIERGMR